MCKKSGSYGDLKLINKLLLVNPAIQVVEKSASYVIYTCQYTANKPNRQVSRNTNKHEYADYLSDFSFYHEFYTLLYIQPEWCGVSFAISKQASMDIIPLRYDAQNRIANIIPLRYDAQNDVADKIPFGYDAQNDVADKIPFGYDAQNDVADKIPFGYDNKMTWRTKYPLGTTIKSCGGQNTLRVRQQNDATNKIPFGYDNKKCKLINKTY